ncbi:MAG: endonuclease VIII [Pseudomonadota bacterium]
MPEGPEIRRAADQVERAVADAEIDSVWFAFVRLKQFEKRLRQSRVLRVETRGKAMLTVFENDLIIYSHNQLYGRWIVTAGANQPQSNRQLRLAIVTKASSAWLFSASDIDVMNRAELSQHPFLRRLGPDLLSQSPDWQEIRDRMDLSEFRNRALGPLLLDQQFLAGLGNYLRAEILFQSRIDPRSKPKSLCRSARNRLAKSILSLTRRSYRTGGLTNAPALVKQLKDSGKTDRESHRFSVYGREGESCYRCKQTVLRMQSGGRSLYFCPGCQTE